MADPTQIAVNTVSQHLQTLAQLQNQVPFTTKFTGNHADTLSWCEAVTNYMDVNLLTDDKIAFRNIFPSLPNGVRSLYMAEYRTIDPNAENAAALRTERFTVEYLKTWVIGKYPPMQSRVDFIKQLKRIRVRKNEDPIIVWNKLIAKVAEVDNAIATINKSLAADNQMLPLTDHNKWEICCSIFINNNNSPKLGNDGVINAETKKTISKANPQSCGDFTQMFANIHDSLIPKCMLGVRKFIISIFIKYI